MRRLIVCAAILHVALAVVLFAAGRAQIAPGLINRDGIVSRIGIDSFLYQKEAKELALTLRRNGATAWLRSASPPHVRVISLMFLLFAPVVGSSPLAAEGFNLLCYLSVVALVFAITREAGGGRRESLAAAGIAALWPTFLLHTLQLLKDALFVAGTLALVFIILTCLTRTYDWRHALAAGLMLLLVIGALLAVRTKFAVFVVALLALALILLVIRELVERRLLLPNLTVIVVLLALTAAVMARPLRTYEERKAYPSPDTGESKQIVRMVAQARVVRTTRGRGVRAAADRAALAAGVLRNHFLYADSDSTAGSGLDDEVTFGNARDLAAYLPRAAAIGLWAPFPTAWFAPGHSVGASGRLIAGVETLAIYLCEMLAIVAVLRTPRRLPALLMLVIAAGGVIAEGVVVSNVGALYRFRYSFWMLLMILGVIGLAKLRGKLQAPLVTAAAMLFLSCSHRPLDMQHGALNISNMTGHHIRGFYLSPHDAKTWQENVLGKDVVADGERLRVHMAPEARNVRWDMRIDSGRGYRAEWFELDLTRVAALELQAGRGNVVANIEEESGE